MKRIIVMLFLSTMFLNAQSKSLLNMKTELKENYKYSIEDNGKEKANKKSVGLAVLYSALLPGMGELYAGDYSTGKYFTIVEGLLWGTYFGLDYYSAYQKDNYIAFAESNAGVLSSNKDDEFWGNIGNYSDVFAYNNEMDLNRDFDLLYDETSHYWQWASTSVRREYRDMWLLSETAKNSLVFIVGGMLLNRIASVVNAIRITKNYNNNVAAVSNFHMNFSPKYFVDNSIGLSVNINHRL